ncbi:3085_t:CDS:1, partial [Funneliformis geosporum]
GDLVLMYKSNIHDKKKLEDRWKGPYYIHDDLGNGVYKLRTMDRKILKTPINSARLK